MACDANVVLPSIFIPTENGFIGYSEELLLNNTLPDYNSGESFFTVFGVFFPAATGTMEFDGSFRGCTAKFGKNLNLAI